MGRWSIQRSLSSDAALDNLVVPSVPIENSESAQSSVESLPWNPLNFRVRHTLNEMTHVELMEHALLTRKQFLRTN